MYTSYRLQYTFGQGPVDFSDLSASDVVYMGNEAGMFANVGTASNSTTCTPIDLKAEGQMAYQKARLDFKLLTAFTGSGATGVISLMTCPDNGSGAPATASAVELLSIPVSTAAGLSASSEPWLEITMPSNCQQYVFLKVTIGATAFSTGDVLIHFNPNN